MTREELDRVLTEIFSDIFGKPGDSFGAGTNPDTLPEWDSLAHIRLISALEERFDRRISLEDQVDMLSFELIGDIMAAPDGGAG